MSLKERIYSILIVSAADNFNSSLKELLSESKYSNAINSFISAVHSVLSEPWSCDPKGIDNGQTAVRSAGHLGLQGSLFFVMIYLKTSNWSIQFAKTNNFSHASLHNITPFSLPYQNESPRH